MSTTIYNAYKLKINNISDLFDFINTLKQECHARAVKQIYSKISENAAQLIDVLTVSKKHPELMQQMDLEIQNGLPKDLTIEQMIKKNIKCQYEPEWTQQIVLFHKNNDIYLIAFGKIIANLLNDIQNPKNKTEQLFLKTYQITDYHYQNKTDPPNEISDQEYEIRRQIWTEIMPTGIPAQDGTVIQLCDAKSINYAGNLFMDNNKIIFPSKQTRVHNFALNLTNQAYITYNMRISEISKIMQNIKLKIQNKSGDEYALYKKYTDILMDTIPEIDKIHLSMTPSDFK